MSKAENPQLYGVWKTLKSENMAAVMEKAGAPWMARKMGANAKPTVTITKIDDKHLKIISKSTMFTAELVHEIDGVVETQMPMQSEKQTVYTEWQDGKLIFYSSPAGADDPRASGVQQIREVLPDGQMRLTVKHGDVVGYRWFQRES